MSKNAVNKGKFLIYIVIGTKQILAFSTVPTYNLYIIKNLRIFQAAQKIFIGDDNNRYRD